MEELLRIYPNDNLSFNIDNLSGENTEEFAEFEVILQKEGKEISKETVDISIEPGNNYWYFLNPPEDLVDGEYVYTFTGKTTKPINENKKGSEISHSQKIFVKEGNPAQVEYKEYAPIEVNEDSEDVVVKGDGFEAKFSKVFGGLVDLKYEGKEYLDSKPLITFWRPFTDTELHLGHNYDMAFWLGATIGQQLLPEKYYAEYVENGYKLIFVYRYPVPGGQESAVIYTIFNNGTIDVETTYSGLATVDYVPTFAMNFKLNKQLDAFKYYGYGPEENYVDTTEGLDLNVYESTVKKNFYKKDRPQETGNRTGVRWAEVYNSKTGKGLKFTALDGVFEFNALPYNDLEIEAASSPNDLPRTGANTNVRIAAKVTGIGTGDWIEEWARVDAGEMLELKFNISPTTVEIPKKATPKPAKKAEEPAKKEEPVKAEAPKEEAKVETVKEETPKVEVKKEEAPKVEAKAETPKKAATSKVEKSTKTVASKAEVKEAKTEVKAEIPKAETKVEEKKTTKAAPKRTTRRTTATKAKTTKTSKK